MRTLTRENLLDMLYGCAILGTGGGSLDEGIQMIDEALAAGKEFKLTTFEEMSPDDVIGIPYACDCGDASFPAIHMLTGQINVVPRFGSIQGTIVFDGSVTPPFGIAAPYALLLQFAKQ